MKKSSIILAMAAVVLGLSSCETKDDPKFHDADPATFKINTPALQNIEFETSGEQTDNATFNLFCSQPDYGYAAICNYSALVSLDPECPEDKAVALDNQTPKSAQMAIKLYDLSVAVNKLLGVTDEEQYAASAAAQGPMKLYFRAVCEIAAIPDTRVVSSNVVSYNSVKVAYAVPKAAWIYICGDVANPTTGLTNGFLAPSSAYLDLYNENFAVYEPEDMIGEKLYVGQFILKAKAEAADPATSDPANVDQCAQFRFFTELLGWTNAASLGSNEADFYVLPITGQWAAGNGYGGDVVNQGLGNWGAFVTVDTPFTVVVDQPALKIYVREGNHNVVFNGSRVPEFQ